MGTLTLCLKEKPFAARRILHGRASFLKADSHCGIVAAASSETLSAFCSRRAIHFLRRTRPSPESEEHAAGIPTLPSAQQCPETLLVHFGLRLDVRRKQQMALRYDMHTLLRAAATSRWPLPLWLDLLGRFPFWFQQVWGLEQSERDKRLKAPTKPATAAMACVRNKPNAKSLNRRDE